MLMLIQANYTPNVEVFCIKYTINYPVNCFFLKDLLRIFKLFKTIFKNTVETNKLM